MLDTQTRMGRPAEVEGDPRNKRLTMMANNSDMELFNELRRQLGGSTVSDALREIMRTASVVLKTEDTQG